MENLNVRLAELAKSIKFNKCFRDDESKQLVKELTKEFNLITNQLKEIAMCNATKEMIARLKYQEVLVKEGYTYEQCAEMSLVELRDEVDMLFPLTITNASVTMRGGKTKKVTVVRKSA